MSTTVRAPIKDDIPSNFEHIFEETGNDIGVACFLLEICNKFEVRIVFSLVGCRCERDVNVFTHHPLVEVISDLKAVLAPLLGR